MDPDVADKTLVVLLAHAKGAALPAPLGRGDTPRSDVTFSFLAMLAHLAAASTSLRALVLERVPELRSLGRATRAKRDALRSIRAELARYGLRKAATPLQRGERHPDAAAALDRELAALAGWLSDGLRELETSAVPPDVRLVSEFAIESAFRTAARNSGMQFCSEDEWKRASDTALNKLFANILGRERFCCPRGPNSVEVACEARDAGFITAAHCTVICRSYAAVTALMLAPLPEDAASLPLMPQRAADTAGAWEAFERYVRDRLGCQRFQTARRLLLEDAGMRVAHDALHDGLRKLRLDTAEQAQQKAAAKRGHMVQRAFAYVTLDICNIICGAFPINDMDCDFASLRDVDEDDWSSEEEDVDEESDEESWEDEAEDEEEAESENEDED